MLERRRADTWAGSSGEANKGEANDQPAMFQKNSKKATTNTWHGLENTFPTTATIPAEPSGREWRAAVLVMIPPEGNHGSLLVPIGKGMTRALLMGD